MKGILAVLFSILCFYAYAQVNEPTVQKAQEHYNKGEEYSLKGDYYKANEEFKKAEELLAKSGNGKEKRGNYDVSKITKKNVENSKGDNRTGGNRKIEDILEKAKDAVSEGNNDDAIKYYLGLLAFEPRNPDIYYNLGVEYLKKRDYFDATQEFTRVLKLDPKDADACYNLGILYEVFMNDKNMARIYYKKYLKLKPDAPDSSIIQEWIDSLGSKR